MTELDNGSGFDAAAYKLSTEQQWQEVARAWHEWTPRLDVWLSAATEQMLDMAGIGSGSRVLDLAAGTGGQSLLAARRAGPQGHVLATDISSRILDFARQNALEAGLGNLMTAVMDGENLDVEEASFDAAISRLGLMFFPDLQRSLAGIGRALRPGGRFAAIVFSAPEKNRFISDPARIVREFAKLAPPQPGEPGLFSLSVPGVLAGMLGRAGFSDVQEEVLDSRIQLSNADECLRLARESFGALHQMLSGLDEETKEAAWREVHVALREFDSDHGFHGPCELLVAGGTWLG